MSTAAARKSVFGKLAEPQAPSIPEAAPTLQPKGKMPTKEPRGTVLRLSTAQLRQLRAVAYEQERSMQSVLQEALGRYIRSLGMDYKE